jgi:hypothetical protein
MLETPPQDGNRKTVLVAIGERGGYAALNYEFCHQRAPLYQGKWLVNPFAFFGAAFGAGDQPIPDTTTASGNRLYFSTLVIEGWTRSSKVEDFRDSMAGEVVLRELIAAFRNLPVTIDPQDKEVPKVGRSGEQAQATLQRLLVSPNADPVRHRLATMRSRFDSEYPSISNLAPLIGAGPDLIIIEPMSDETAFNNASPVGESEFSALRDTVANTDTPRRLKPLSINYHAYAGEYPALLRSVKDRLRAASQAPLTPVSSNRYAAIVEGFFSARVDRVGSAAWRISQRGELETVRFDAAEGRDVDIRSSVGVIGQRRNGTTLYVALDQAIEPAVVVLGPPAASRAGSGGFGLVESRWLVRHVVRGECALSFEAQGYGDGSFTWSDAASGRYTITVDRSGQEIWRQTAEADGAGRLTFDLPVSAVDRVTIRVNCTSAAQSAEH